MSDDEEKGDQDMDYPPASSAAAAAASSSAAATVEHIDLTDPEDELRKITVDIVSPFKEMWNGSDWDEISSGADGEHCFFNCILRALNPQAGKKHKWQEVIELIDAGLDKWEQMMEDASGRGEDIFASNNNIIMEAIAAGIMGSRPQDARGHIDFADVNWNHEIKKYKKRNAYSLKQNGGAIEAQLITLGTPDIVIWTFSFRPEDFQSEWTSSAGVPNPPGTRFIYLFHIHEAHWDMARFHKGSMQTNIADGQWVRDNQAEWNSMMDVAIASARPKKKKEKQKKTKPNPASAAAASSSSSSSHAPQPPADSSEAAAYAFLEMDISELSREAAEAQLEELTQQLTSGELTSLPGYKPHRTNASRDASVNSSIQEMRRNHALVQLDAARRIVAAKQRAAGGAGNYRPLRRRPAAAEAPSSLQVYDNASFTPSSKNDFDERKPLWAIRRDLTPYDFEQKRQTELRLRVRAWCNAEDSFEDLRKLIAVKVEAEGGSWVNKVIVDGHSIIHLLADSSTTSDASTAKMFRWLKNNTEVDMWKGTAYNAKMTALKMANYKRRAETAAFIASVPGNRELGAAEAPELRAAEARQMIIGDAIEKQRKRRQLTSASSTSPDRSGAAAQNKRSRKDGSGAEVVANSGVEVVELRSIDRALAELFNRDDSTAAETPRLVNGLAYVGPDDVKKEERLFNALHTYFYPRAYAGESAEATELRNRHIRGNIDSDNYRRKSRVDNTHDPGMSLWNAWSKQVHAVPPLDMTKSIYYKIATHAPGDPGDFHFGWLLEPNDDLGTGSADVDAFLMCAVHANLRVNGMETIVQQDRLHDEIEAERLAMYWNSVARWFYSPLDSIHSRNDPSWRTSKHRAELLKGLIAFVQSPEANARQRRIRLYRLWYENNGLSSAIKSGILTKYVGKRALAKPSAEIGAFEAAADAAAAAASSSSSSSSTPAAAPWSWSAASAVAAVPSSSSHRPLPLISAPSSAAAAAASPQSHRTHPQTAAASASSSAAAAASSSAPAPSRAAPVPEKSIEEIKAMRAADREERDRLKAILLSK